MRFEGSVEISAGLSGGLR